MSKKNQRNEILYRVSAYLCSIFLCADALAEQASQPSVIEPPSCCVASSRTAAVPMNLFAEKLAWKFADATAWQWSDDLGGTLALTKQNDYKPPFRSPTNLAWFATREWSSFKLTLECQLNAFNEGNNDLCIAFGGNGADQFYYVHLGEKADAAHHQIHIVNKADRSPITTWRNAGTPWKKDTWHQVRVIRNAATGDIGVWFDQDTTPALTARDKSLSWGLIALGSFDDKGRFRKVCIQGTSRGKK